MQRLRLTRNPAELEGKVTRSIFGIPLKWPSWLSNAWPRVLFFLLLGTFSTTLVAVPDGSMADYLASLEKVLALPYTRYVPAHGGPIADGPGYGRALLAHRRLRNRQIADAVAAGVTRISELLDRIYPTLAANLRFAAAMTLRAHIEYLADQGAIRMRRGVWGTRLSPV